MVKIVTIGGGDIRTNGTTAIDKEIVRFSGKKHPALLFIPTASSDSEGYWETVKEHFTTLGCTTNVLYLIREHPTAADIKRKIAAADIIYVGGGNTLKMMRLWRQLGVDKLLIDAGKRGAVLCGISAGSICWYESGHSDSMSFYNPKKWKYINVHGLGLLKGVHCPHYDSMTLKVPRKKHFQQMMQKIGGIGIAIEDGCALQFDGNTFRVLIAKKHAKAYRVYKRKGKVVSTQIVAPKFLPIHLLYSRSEA